MTIDLLCVVFLLRGQHNGKVSEGPKEQVPCHSTLTQRIICTGAHFLPGTTWYLEFM